MAVALLRNGWYWENYAAAVDTAEATGSLFGAAGDGRVACAARKDFAEAAAVVLLADGQAGKVYELGGDERLTYPELADVLSKVVGKPVAYQDLSRDAYAKALEDAGVPAPMAAVLADYDACIAVGAPTPTAATCIDSLGVRAPPAERVLAR